MDDIKAAVSNVSRAGQGKNLFPFLRSQMFPCVPRHDYPSRPHMRGAASLFRKLEFRGSESQRVAITETELKLIAAAAIIGLSSKPNSGYKTPAARGIPKAL
jgi:hypothetical protein